MLLCEVIGDTQLTQNGKFKTLETRLDNQDALDSIIEKWTSVRSPMDAMKALQKKGVPSGAVQHPEDRMDHDPNSLAWNTFPEVQHDEMGPVRVEGMPMKFSKTPAVIEYGGPLLGQDNDFVYKEILQMDDDEIQALHDEGVI